MSIAVGTIRLILMLTISLSLMMNSISYAKQGNTVQGLWVPVTGVPHGTSILKLQKNTSKSLYAFGGGKSLLYVAESSEDGQWYDIGIYAPQLLWTEGEKIEAFGPFDPSTLDLIESEVSSLIEDIVEQQQDENFLSEDTAQSFIDQYLNEAYPASDSPYFLKDVHAHSLQGVVLQTGRDLWHVSKESTYQLQPRIDIDHFVQSGPWIWVSNAQGIFYKSFVKDDRSAWIKLSDMSHAKVTHDGTSLWILHQKTLYQSKQLATPKALYSLPFSSSKLLYAEQKLWALDQNNLYLLATETDKSKPWDLCIQYPYVPRTLHILSSKVVATLDDAIYVNTLNQASQSIRQDRHPNVRNQTFTFYDATWFKDQLYVATQQGIFIWQEQTSTYRAGVKYYQRALQNYPRFDTIYRTALQVNELDPQQNTYGNRPLLSALLPQLRLRFQTNPQRSDNVPTFADGSRQLTLHQPRPEYQVYAEWRLSFEFLAALIDPTRANTMVEVQNQIQNAVDAPGSDLSVEEALDINFDNLDQDSSSAQAQRLAMTTIAVEKRQMQRDRVALYKMIQRLYQERFTVLYRILTQKKSEDARQQVLMLRVQEIDALFDALTNYYLKITKSVQQLPIHNTF